MSRRVAVTGMAGISPLGNDWAGIRTRLASYRNAITRMPEWADYDGLNTQLAAPAADFTLSERYTSKTTRSMGRVALMATRASELALIDAGLAGRSAAEKRPAGDRLWFVRRHAESDLRLR